MNNPIHIKNMVCDRCVRAVSDIFQSHHIITEHITLGEVQLSSAPGKEQLEEIKTSLEEQGFELLEDRNSKTISRIKNLVIDMVHHRKEAPRTSLSDYLEKEIGRDYHTLSALFSAVEGITIEKFLIAQRLEKVKELLVYGELTLSQIAYKLHYSSVQHLSNQFRKAFGMSPTEFKKQRIKNRTPLDKV